MKTQRSGESGGAQTTASSGGKPRTVAPGHRGDEPAETTTTLLGGSFFGVVDEIMDFYKGAVA